MAIQNQIKTIREAKQIKQQTVASALGISQSSYADIENGISKIKVDDLLKIAQTLEVGIEELLRDDELS